MVCVYRPLGTRNFGSSRPYREKRKPCPAGLMRMWCRGQSRPSMQSRSTTLAGMWKRSPDCICAKQRDYQEIYRHVSWQWCPLSGGIIGNFSFLSVLRAFLKLSARSRWLGRKRTSTFGKLLNTDSSLSRSLCLREARQALVSHPCP